MLFLFIFFIIFFLLLNSSNIIHCILFLTLYFFFIGIVTINLLKMQFFGFLFIIIYIGAIIIFMLFSFMLVNIKKEIKINLDKFYILILPILYINFKIIYNLKFNFFYYSKDFIHMYSSSIKFNNLQIKDDSLILSLFLYNKYFIFLPYLGLLLFFSIIISILLSTTKKLNFNKREIYYKHKLNSNILKIN